MSNDWLNLQYLAYALEVEKAGSISKAAENLYMNQPNLSKAIKELETMIGVSIFERTTKGVSATTEDGRIFLEYAKNILAQFNDMKAHFQNSNDGRNTFNISIPRASYITEAFSFFVNSISDRDNFYITFKETNSLEAIKNVTENGYDLAIIRYRTIYEKFFLPLVLDKELCYSVLLDSESVIIMSEKNRLANIGKCVLEPSDFSDMIEIANNDFSTPRQLPAEKKKANFIPQNKKQIFVYERGSQFDLLANNPNAFMWVSPMPQSALSRNSLIQKKCNAKNIGFKDVLIYQRNHSFNEFEKAFLNSIELVKKSIQ